MHKITSIDPEAYKNQIIAMWRECLPGTPSDRFDWLNACAAQGPATWVAAVDEYKKDLLGIVSILPKRFYSCGRSFHGGIVGDVMVDKRYRGKGLGCDILTHVQKTFGPKTDFLYIIPNKASKKIVKKVGFTHFDTLQTWLLPVDVLYYRNYINNKMLIVLLKKIAVLRNKAHILASIFIQNRRYVRTMDCKKNNPEILNYWQMVKKDSQTAVGDHSPEYLHWRLNGSLDEREILVCKNSKNNVKGCLIYSIKANKLFIKDICTLKRFCAMQLLLTVIELAIKKDLAGIYITISPADPFFPWLKWMGMINAKDPIEVYYTGDQEMLKNGWRFFELDRNLQ